VNVLVEFFRLNGADNENNSFRPLDLNGNALKTSSGSLTIDASTSGGTGDISLTSRGLTSITPLINQSITLTTTGTGDINLSSADKIVISTQLTLPNSLSATTFAAGILTCDFNSVSTGIFTATITANMTGITFSNGRVGGQYVIYVSASGGTITIASTLSGTTNKTNYTTAISVLTTSVALLTVTFDGTNYIIAGSAYN
jgi:hypothetical protein